MSLNHITFGASKEQRRGNDTAISDNKLYFAEQLEELLESADGDKEVLLARLKELGMTDADGRTGFEEKTVEEITEAIRLTIEQFNEGKPVSRLRDKAGGDVHTSLAESTETSDITPEDPRLAQLKADFDKGLKVVNADGELVEKGLDMTWEQCVGRMNKPHHLNPDKKGWELAMEIPGGGQLFAVDEEGKLCIKNRGQEPVIYKWIEGEDGERELATIVNRDHEMMSKKGEYADYWEVYEAVYGPVNAATGYELFPDMPDYEKRGLVAAVEAFTGKDFVRSADGNEWRAAWLNNGRDVNKERSGARRVDFYPRYRNALVSRVIPSGRTGYMGASLLLRV